MKSFSLGTFLLLNVFLPLESWAQSDTLFLPDNFSNHNFPAGLSYFESKNISADSAWRTFRSHSPVVKKLTDDNFGIVSEYFWFSTVLTNRSDHPARLYFVVEHSHLKRLCFYEVEDSPKLKSETGYQFNFYHRAVPHRYFLFPVELRPKESKAVLLLVDQQNSLNLPMSLWAQDAFHHHDYLVNLTWGIGLGFIAFCAVFALAGAVLLRQSVFVWYFFYILSAFLYGFTELGFSFQFLFPALADFEGAFSIQTSLYNFVFFIKFSQSLLGTRHILPRIHRVLNGIFYFIVGMVLADWFLTGWVRPYAYYYLPIVFIVILVGLSLLAFCGIYSLKTNRAVATLYLSASGIVIISALLSIPNTVFGLSANWGFNPVMIGYFLEVTFLSCALLIQYRQVQQERGRLVTQVAEQQQQMYKKYLEGIERERSRIAGELHDDIGSRLSNIKHMLSQPKEQIGMKLDAIIADIRHISHDLAPPSSAIAGLAPIVEQFIAEVQTVIPFDLSLRFFDYEEKFNPAQILQVYRIVQEAVHNIVNHAQASRADIQFFGYEKELVLVIEDDGIGFEVEQKINGIGISQIKIRTQNLGGRIEINSTPGKGTHLLIEIPYS